MTITELDEWQGITADMVREWLKRTGWELRTDEWGEKRWFNGNGRSIADKRVLVTDGFRWIASQSVQTVQALLREINPREREGVPSEAARQAHPGNWLVSGCLNQSKEKHFEVWHSRNLHLASNYPYNPDGKRIACWPLDEHGSKVRWPTDSEGKML